MSETEAVEDEPLVMPKSWKILLHISLTVQLIAEVSATFLGIYMFTACEKESKTFVDFAGFSCFLNFIYSILLCITFMLLCMLKRKALLILSILDFAIASMIVVYESASKYCAEPGPIKTQCSALRVELNVCRWMDGNMHWTVHENIVLPEDNFGTVRQFLFYASIASLAASIATVVLVLTGFKDAKYQECSLRKRHKNSILVGHSSNVHISLSNKGKNIDLTSPNEKEEREFRTKTSLKIREYFGGDQTSKEETEKEQNQQVSLKISPTDSQNTHNSLKISHIDSPPTWSSSSAP